MSDLIKLNRLLTLYTDALEKSNISAGILAEEGHFFINYVHGVLATVNAILSEEGFPSPHDYLYGIRILKSSTLKTILKTKKAVLQIEEMMDQWIFCFQKIFKSYRLETQRPVLAGPHEEIEYWRKMFIKFDRVYTLLNSHFVVYAEVSMKMTDSQLIKPWNTVKIRISRFYKMIFETLKNLNSVENLFEPLYRKNISILKSSIAYIIGILSMVQTFYKLSLKMRSMSKLLLSCLNQLALSCADYLNDSNTATFWKQPKNVMIEKLEKCIDLKDHVFKCFNRTVKTIDAEGREPFQILFAGTFLHFVRFIDRLIKIKEMFEIYIKYKLKRHTIPKFDKLYLELKSIFSEFTKKRENIVIIIDDQTFEVDSNKFDNEMNAWINRLCIHAHDIIDEIPDFTNKINMLEKCERLNVKGLELDYVYYSTFKNLVMHYKHTFSKYRDDIPITYNLPLMSGQIMWITMMSEKIETPINYLREKSPNLWGKMDLFNSLCSTFKMHESRIHSSWYDNISNIFNTDNVTLLGRDPLTREYNTNLSRFMTETLDVAQIMIYKRHKIPNRLFYMLQHKKKMYDNYRYAERLVERYNQIRQMVPNIFQKLVKFEILKMDKIIIPMLTTTMWSSSGAMDLMLRISKNFDYSERFMKTVSDMNQVLENQIENIKQFILIKLPENAICPYEFETLNEVYLEDIMNQFKKKSISLENQFYEIIKIIRYRINAQYAFKKDDDIFAYSFFDVKKATEEIKETDGETKREDVIQPALHPTNKQIDEWCMTAFRYYNYFYTNAFVKMMTNSFDFLSTSLSNGKCSENNEMVPFLKIKLIIKDFYISIEPSWNSIFFSLKQLTIKIQKSTKNLNLFGFHRIKDDKHFYKNIIAKDTAVKTSIGGMHQSTLPIRNEISNVVENYNAKYRTILIDESQKISNISNFVREKHGLEDVRNNFNFLNREIDEIDNELLSIVIGPFEIELIEFKNAVKNEIKEWQRLFAEGLLEASKLNYLSSFVSEKYNLLTLPINELVDARRVILCLEEIQSNITEIDNDIDYTISIYDLLTEYNVTIHPDDERELNLLFDNYQKLKTKMGEVSQRLLDIYIPLRKELKDGIKQLKLDVIIYNKEFEERGPMVKGLKPYEAAERVLLFQDRLDDLVTLMERYQDGERLFGTPVTDFPAITENKRVFNLLKKLYDLYNKINRSIDIWSNTLWNRLRIDDISESLLDYSNRCRKLPSGLKQWPTYLELKSKIDEWSEKIPLVEMMYKNGLKERHWVMLENVTDTRLPVYENDFALKNIMAAPLLENKDEVEDICQTAIKEIDIEAKLRQVIADWSVIKVQLSTFKNRGLLLVKGQELGEVVALLEDSQMIMSSLASNRYNIAFKTEIMLWVKKFQTTSIVLENWILVQNLWMYLEAVFVGGDISKQLPLETRRFMAIDKLWVQIMTKARFIENIIEICTGDGSMAILLPYMFEQLESCQKSLAGYLDQKRYIFSRFYFISDPVLLEILGQASNSHVIQPHLLSLFDNIYKLTYSPTEYDKALELISKEGEKIPLEHPVVCVGGVENWLNVLLNESKNSVNQVLTSVANYITDDSTFTPLLMVENFPSQMGLVGIQMVWTNLTETAIKNATAKKTIMKQTNTYFILLLNSLIDCTTRDLTKMERLKFETLITIHVHQRDIFETLYRMKVTSVSDFEWLKQERFYFNRITDCCEVRITDVIIEYQNEYLGCSDRLVITPLTDRCYITLAQAVGMNMGGAPAGPAGTGKTETTKDMGKSLGKYVVVFNCSDQMDYRGLGRIFKGLVHSGTWGCFDEFNRIELPVLSVAAQQIYIVFSARRDKKEIFNFGENDMVPMNPEFAIFLTMNPGYAGRQELPENLKVLFRSVAMMVPDRLIIIRVKLAACGFKNNQLLSKKFFILYELCEEQLSKQVHYDFGLRNILAVLRTLGTQRRGNPNDSEETILMRVLRGMNVSKLVDQDEMIFMSLIEDLFVGMKLTSTSYKELQSAITITCNEKSFVNNATWNLKIIQIYETSLVRHGLMILGPTGSGKTAAIHCLLSALTKTGLSHFEYRMNPKAITAPQMFGRLDVATNDWTDGIFSTLWRRTLKLLPTEFCWIVLDGPVDAVWIENLNSVLDDNKTLTLANGDRIVMAPNAKLCFEPDNVDNASPATISRMGMTFFSSTVLSWKIMFQGWGKNKSKDVFNTFQNLFDNSYDELLKMLQARLMPKMSLLEAHYIRQTCDILDGLLDSFSQSSDLTENVLSRLYTFSIMWSVAAVLESADRLLLEDFIKIELKGKMNIPKLKDGESIYEYTVSMDGEWQHWKTLINEYSYPSDYIPAYGDILVPNLDNVRTMFLITLIAKQEKNVLLIGEQGTAKTVMIKSYMQEFNPELRTSKMLNFSSATTPNMFQYTVEGYMEKRFGTTYGPPGNRKMTIFIDDINMPIINAWGDQVTNEITRQLLENKGFYSLTKPGDYINIVGVNMLGAMIHPGGGRNDIPPRLKRQFCIFNCTLPSDTSMDKIFGALGCGYFCEERFSQPIVQLVTALVPLTRIVWQKTKQKLLPTPANFHYVFNLRDLSRIWEGMLQIYSKECLDITMLIKLWCHEMQRVIFDKLTSASDKHWFIETVKNTAQEFLDPQEFILFPENMTNIVFVDFMRDMVEPTGDEPDDYVPEVPKIYEYIENFEILEARMLMYMNQMNEYIRGSSMDLVFFKDCMIHLIIISRILRIPRGNGLLVGVGGSGRRSVTTLASFIAGYLQHSIFLTRAYGINNFLDDIRLLYKNAGFLDSKTTFVFTDNDIKEEAFLEYINNILSSGEVANLFPKDELEEMLNNLTPSFKKKYPKSNPSMDNVYEFFIKQAMNNLHLVLCFSPIGESFRLRSLKFPGIISGCIIDWYTAWPPDALLAVSHHSLHNFPVVGTLDEKISLIQLLGEIHADVAKDCLSYFQRFRRQIFVTPKSFLSFVDGYKKLYVKNKQEIENMKVQRILGLEKLADASIQVELLKEELIEKEKDILIATAASTEVTTKVNEVVKAAEISKAEVAVVKDRAELLLKGISKEKKLTEVKLAAAKPAMDAAEAALLTINATDIATVRKLGKPPYLITLIMDAVLIFFRRKVVKVQPDPAKIFLEPSWSESLKLMSDTRFLYNLQNFPKDQISGELIDLLQPYFKYPGYTFDKAKIACGNVAGLLSWTLAMSDFYNVNKEVLPLKANLAKQETKHLEAKIQLKLAEDIANEKNRQLLEAKRQLNTALSSQKGIQDEANKCKNKMDSASALIEGLDGERKRWTQQLAGFNSEIKYLLGDIVILTGFLSYSGPFNQEYRTHILESWYQKMNDKAIPNSPNLNVTEKLADPPTISEWNLQGLPNDELSTQNGIIVTKSSKYPIMIDPQSQGVFWIKNKEAINDMIVTSFDNKYFRNNLEDCISLGKPLLIQDILQDVDPVLNNVLDKNFYKVGKSLKVLLGDKEVDVTENFRLYLTSKLGNPSYPPELYARCSIIDFTVTIKGLEDQLLSRVIETEKKELEQKRIELITEVTSQKRKMQELEHDLLIKLTTVKGSLVDDESVLYTLNKTKDTAFDVNEKLKVASITQASINLVREEYRPIATRGSVLYFLIVEIGLVNPMYQNSLQQFLERFDISLSDAEVSIMLSRRIHNIIETLTYVIFKYKCRGLYEKHKTLFTILMTLKIDIDKGKITKEQFEYFIKGGASIDLNSINPKPFSWVTDTCWMNLGLLQTIPPFSEILNMVERNQNSWKMWYEKSSPEKEPIPGYDQLNAFQKLLVIRAWCPDRTLNQAFSYVEESLGPQYVETVMLNVPEMYTESRSTTPLICFLSMGSDPSNLIENTAKKMEIPFQSISMGQGQEVHARRLLNDFMINGGWILLQNCHLCLDFMQETFVYINTTVATSSAENFRIWITTEVHPKFSISLLQISVHYTYEPPEGLRAGLLRTYKSMGEDILNYSNLSQYKSVLYVISFLHSVVQERRKFGPVGWNIPYEFNTSDWYCSTLYLQKMIDEVDANTSLNWIALRYMIAEVHYGGRVTDDYDRRLLNNFTRLWFNDSIFEEQFSFYKGYNVMNFESLSKYLSAIEDIALKDPPQACGLHPNTDITYQTNIVQEMCDTIILIQPKGSSGGSEVTREDKVYAMTKDILSKLPQAFNLYTTKERLTIMGATQPMNIFLGQEIDRIQKVIELVKSTMEDLLLAIDGIIIMNEILSDTLDYLYDGRIPTHWLRISWTSSAIGFWFDELLKRHNQIKLWIFKEKPAKFWMTGFFNPQGFLTAMKQEVSRAHKGWTLDNMMLENQVTFFNQTAVNKPPLEGVYVYGLFLDGASWNWKTRELQESLHKIMFTEMPVIHVYAINLIDTKPMMAYRCPVYKKPKRTGLTYVCELNLQTPRTILPNHWILRGVALLCDIK